MTKFEDSESYITFMRVSAVILFILLISIIALWFFGINPLGWMYP